MFWKLKSDGYKKSIDLTDIHLGESCFLLGSGPTLNDYDLNVFYDYSIPTIAINNAAILVKPNYWISTDEPVCFAPSIIKDPTYLKFANWSRRDSKVDSIKWQDYPNTLFYGATKENYDFNNFLYRRSQFVWWKNTWYIALQLAYRLGFRTVYTIGTDFTISQEAQYAFESNLSSKELKSNSTLYDQTITKMVKLKPHFDECKFRLVSCSSTSRLNNYYEYEDFERTVNKLRWNNHLSFSSIDLPHSLTNYEKVRKSPGNP